MHHIHLFNILFFTALLLSSCGPGGAVDTSAGDIRVQEHPFQTPAASENSDPLPDLPLLEEDRFRNEEFKCMTIHDEYGLRHHLSGIRYDLFIRFHKNGKLFIESVEDKEKQEKEWKEYYENGQLKKEGVMLPVHHTCIRTWKFYSAEGKTDSVINYDLKHGIGYDRAVEIGKSNGFQVPQCDIQLTVEDGKWIWLFLENINESGEHNTLHIDAETGKIIESDHRHTSIICT